MSSFVVLKDVYVYLSLKTNKQTFGRRPMELSVVVTLRVELRNGCGK